MRSMHSLRSNVGVVGCAMRVKKYRLVRSSEVVCVASKTAVVAVDVYDDVVYYAIFCVYYIRYPTYL